MGSMAEALIETFFIFLIIREFCLIARTRAPPHRLQNAARLGCGAWPRKINHDYAYRFWPCCRRRRMFCDSNWRATVGDKEIPLQDSVHLTSRAEEMVGIAAPDLTPIS